MFFISWWNVQKWARDVSFSPCLKLHLYHLVPFFFPFWEIFQCLLLGWNSRLWFWMSVFEMNDHNEQIEHLSNFLCTLLAFFYQVLVYHWNHITLKTSKNHFDSFVLMPAMIELHETNNLILISKEFISIAIRKTLFRLKTKSCPQSFLLFLISFTSLCLYIS